MDIHTELAQAKKTFRKLLLTVKEQRQQLKENGQALRELTRTNRINQHLKTHENLHQRIVKYVDSELVHKVFYSFFETEFTMVDVILDGERIHCPVKANDTFLDLRKDTAYYFMVPPTTVFFSNTPPDPQKPPSLFLLSSNVLEEAYVWGTLKLRGKNYQLYLILNNSAGNPSESSAESAVEETPLELADLKPEDGRRVSKRTVIEALLWVGLVSLWVFSVISEQSVLESSWCNNIYFTQFSQQRVAEFDHLYMNTAEAGFWGVSNEAEFWGFLDLFADLLYSSMYPARINEFNLFYGSLQLRQLRSEVEDCESGEIERVRCAKKYMFSHDTSEFSMGTEGFTYDSEGEFAVLMGIVDFYGLDGFKAELPISDYGEWRTLLDTLSSNDWVDAQTRVIFITSNVVNFNVGVATSFSLVLEIASKGAFVPNIKSFSIHFAGFGREYVLVHSLVGLFAVGLLLLQLSKHCNEGSRKEDVDCMKSRQYETALKETTCEEDVSRWQRIKRSTASERSLFLILLYVLSLEVAQVVWYLGDFANLDPIDNEYLELMSSSILYAILLSMRELGIVLLLYPVILLVKQCFQVEQFFLALSSSLQSAYLLSLLAMTISITFATVLFYILGPYAFQFSEYSHSYLSILMLVLGNFSIDSSFGAYTGPTGISFLLISFRFITYLFTLILASEFQEQFYQAKLKLLSNN